MTGAGAFMCRSEHFQGGGRRKKQIVCVAAARPRSGAVHRAAGVSTHPGADR